MTADPQLLYLEPDDEITSVVRRLRQTDAARIVLVAPGRARATSSAVALRLLARVAGEERRQLAVVGDALTRSLAGEAGLAAFAAVGDARDGVAAAPVAEQRAKIHIVRGDEATAALADPRPRPRPQPTGEDPTRELAAVAAAGVRVAGERVRRLPLAALAIVLVLLAAAGAAAAVLLPSATVAITPQARAIGPLQYEIAVSDPSVESGTLTASATGSASGTYHELAAASGVATFRNFNTVAIEVPAGTQVAAGDVVFATTAAVVVPSGSLTPQGTIAAGEEAAPVSATAAGPAGNVTGEAIDTILDEDVRNSLRGFPQNVQRLVVNYEPTGGGVDVSGPVIEQADVDAAIEQVRRELASELEAAQAPQEGRLYPEETAMPEPVIEVAEGLVGTRDQPSFEVTGSVEYRRPYVERDEVEEAARERLLANETAVPDGHDLLPSSVEVTVGEARLDGERVVVDAAATARTAPRLDAEAIRGEVAGMTPDAAHDELSRLGRVEIHLWPGWAEQIPTIGWRIDVIVDELERAGG